MKFFFKKAIPAILAFCLVFTMAIPARTAEAASKTKVYEDVSGHKYEDALLYAIENGLMSNSGSKIFPNSRLTKGAACLSLNALLGAVVQFADMDEVGNLKKGDQYYNTVSVGLNAGYLKQKANGDVYSPLAPATYRYVADIFSNVLGIDMSDVIIGNNDSKATLTRAEYAVILQKLAPNIVTKNTSQVKSGDVYITNPNVVLSNTAVDGNLIITDAVGDQNVTLRNVEVSGKLIVRGGGENSIHIIGNSEIKDVVVKQVNNPVSVKVAGNAKVENLQINQGSTNVNIQGKVSKLTVAASDIKVSLDAATVENVEVSGTGTAVAVSETTTVKNVTVNESAAGTTLEVSGTIEDVVVAAKDSAVKVAGKGAVKEVKAEKTAQNFAVAVEKEATIATVSSEAANTIVEGEGKVENAAVTGEGSKVDTKDTVVSDTVTPAPTSTPSTSGGGTSPTATPAPSRITVSKVEVVNPTQIKVTLSANISTATVSVQSLGVDTSVYANNTYTVTLKNPLEHGKEYAITVSRTGYVSGSATVNGSDVPAYKALDAELKASATAINGKIKDYATLDTTNLSKGEIVLNVTKKDTKLSVISLAIAKDIYNLINTNQAVKITKINLGNDNKPISTENVLEMVKSIKESLNIGNNETLQTLQTLSTMHVQLGFTVAGDTTEYSLEYTVKISK